MPRAASSARKRGRTPVADEMALDGAVVGGAGAHELEDFLHLDDVAFHAGDLGDAR